MKLLHLGQCDRGDIIDWFWGVLEITTLRKLPIIDPAIKNKIINSQIKQYQSGKLVNKSQLQLFL